MRTQLMLLTCAALLYGCGKVDAPAPPVPANNAAVNVEPTPPEPWEHQESLDSAVRWILDNQKKTGDWGYMMRRPYDVMLGEMNTLHVWGNSSTALCLMGLLSIERTEEIDAALKRGFEYLIDAPDTPRANSRVFYNTWAHTYMIQALTRAMADERFADMKPRLRRRAEHELKRLLDHQGLDGGWGYYDFGERTGRPSGRMSTTFSTGAVLVALREAFTAGLNPRKLDHDGEGEGLPDHRVEIALNYMERMRFPNGAYAYSTGHEYSPMWDPNLPRGSLGRTQAGDNGLFTWGRTITTDELRKQLDNFFKDHAFIEIGRQRQFPHEAWYATAPYYYYFGHYYAARNVLALPDDIRAEYGAKLAELIVLTQDKDGSFWDYPLYGYHKSYGTGYAVLILSKCKRAMGK